MELQGVPIAVLDDLKGAALDAGMPRLGGDSTGRDEPPETPSRDEGSLFLNDKRRVAIAGIILLFLFLMMKNATSKDYDDSTREYYKSIGMETTARASMSKTELAKERVQLLNAVQTHEQQIMRLQKRVAELEQHARGNGAAASDGSGSGTKGR